MVEKKKIKEDKRPYLTSDKIRKYLTFCERDPVKHCPLCFSPVQDVKYKWDKKHKETIRK